MKSLTVTTAKENSMRLDEGPYQLVSFEGYGDTEAETVLLTGIRQDGAQYIESFLQAKDINLTIRLKANGAQELNEMRQETSRIFNPKNGLLTLVFEDESGPKEIQAVSDHMPKFGGSDARRDGIFQIVQVSLIAPSPYWRKTESIEQPLYSWLPRQTFPITFGTLTQFMQADFSEKISGDYESSPHLVRYSSAGSLRKPAESGVELTDTQLGQISALDGTTYLHSNFSIPQVMIGINALAMLEEEFGPDIWGGDETTAGRITIAKGLITEFHFIWHGYNLYTAGTSKANLSIWLESTGAYQASGGYTSTNNTTITKLDVVSKSAYSTNTPSNAMDAAGWFHALAYGSTSNGTTSSDLHTDYIEFTMQAAGQTLKKTVFGVKGPLETVVNTGGDGAPVLITITGYANGPTVWNQTTGEYITLNTAIAAGERVEINTDDNNLSIDLIAADGTRTDIFSRMSIDSTLFKLAAGENVIEYTAIEQDDFSTVSFTYQELYAGI